MKFAVDFNEYHNRLDILLVQPMFFQDVCSMYESDNHIHMDIKANNWKYLKELNDTFHLFDTDMAGVTLKTMNNELVRLGMMDVNIMKRETRS